MGQVPTYYMGQVPTVNILRLILVDKCSDFIDVIPYEYSISCHVFLGMDSMDWKLCQIVVATTNWISELAWTVQRFSTVSLLYVHIIGILYHKFIIMPIVRIVSNKFILILCQ